MMDRAGRWVTVDLEAALRLCEWYVAGMFLREFERNIYSQFGEDGVLWEILDRVEASISLDKWCVEFGAWDGVYLSNTCNLIRNRGYGAVMIECDPSRIIDLRRNHPGDEVIKLCEFVSIDGERRLESILSGTPLPREFDLLSIDIDGCDYWILDSLRVFRPKIIVIEFNPTIPNVVEYVQAADFALKRGSSAKSLHLLAQSKGYELAATTATNLILIRSDLRPVVLGADASELRLTDVRDDSEVINFAFSGYDGTVMFSRPHLWLPWHAAEIPPARMQPVPRPLRTFPGDWGRGRALAWRVIRRLRNLGPRATKGPPHS